jgi:hypothetical protein
MPVHITMSHNLRRTKPVSLGYRAHQNGQAPHLFDRRVLPLPLPPGSVEVSNQRYT